MAMAERLAAAFRQMSKATSTAVRPHDFGAPTFLGFRCERAVKVGEVLLEVLTSLAITSELAQRDVLRHLGLAKDLPEVTPQDYMCLWLILERERGAASEHADFVQHLPQDLTEMSASFWPDHVLAILGGGEARERLALLRERVEEAYARVSRAVQSAEPPVQQRLSSCLGMESYTWARCVLNSRQFEGSWCSETKTTGVLMPILEFFNHCCELPEGECVRQGGDARYGTVQVIALRDYAAGEEAKISYGRVGNSYLLERGFAVENNPCESVELIMGARYGMRPPERGKDEQGEVGERRYRARVARSWSLAQDLTAATAGLDLEVAHDFEWREPPTTSDSAAEARVTLRRQRPLPKALLALVRMECLSDDEFASAVASRATSSDVRSIAPWGECCERIALGRLLAVAEAMLARLGAAPAGDAGNDGGGPLRQMAAAAHDGERSVWVAFSRAIYLRLVDLLVGLREGRTDELVGGSVWFCHLRSRKPDLEQAQQSGLFAQHFRRLQGLSLAADGVHATDAAHAWAATKVFLWLHDLARGVVSQKAPDASVMASWAGEVSGAPSGALAYLQLYLEKMALWGRYLMAQFLASGTFALSDMNQMQMESVSLRNSNAWSVPTMSALHRLASEAPLVEVGGGNGLWAAALRECLAVDIVCLDTSEWDAKYAVRSDDVPMMGSVQEGGPEQLQAHSERTLVLMRQDCEGRGDFGAACLRNYAGAALVLVGEWPGSTYGLVNAWGQSFSKDFVAAVEADFELLDRLQLPCWPLAADEVMIWRRRR